MKTEINFEKFPVGSKIQSYDSSGYYIMKACGYIVKHLGGGHAIIKDFNNCYYSTLGINNVSEIELL
jgi:predicted house-cleaning NTP pyrophosphatase (Maf/HAM1 superfamily)